MTFEKWEGLGNDFVVLEGPPPDDGRATQWATVLCDRHRGIGADGLVFFVVREGQLTMVIFNSDGSRAEMCGNALRCLAAAAVRRGMARLNERFELATDSGPREVRVVSLEPCLVEVSMGVPADLPGDSGGPGAARLLSMGNPHCVIFDCPPDWQARGAELSLQWNVNVEFVTVLSRTRLDVKVWERGAGATLACGTGACAAMVAAREQDLCDRVVEVLLPGGPLEIEWGIGESVMMRGPARHVFTGEWKGDIA